MLFVDLGSNYGGVEVYLQGLAEMLLESAEIYTLSSPAELNRSLKRIGAHVFSLSWIGSKWFKPLRLLIACIAVTALAIYYQIDTVQLNGYFESLLLIPLRILGKRTIYTMHGPFETECYVWYRDPTRFIPRFLSMHCLFLASTIVCVSETVGNIAKTRLSLEKVVVIPNWVHLPAISPRTGDADDSIRLLYVGRVERYKGVQLILEALRGLSGVELWVVGDGSYRPALEKASAGVPVWFLGFQRELSRFYNSAHIFINPSLGPEGLPLVSLEAMSHGVACIFSDLPVHREISHDGEAAALFLRGDAHDLRRQISRLLEDRLLMRQLAEAGRQAVEHSYSFQVAARKYHDLLS